MKEGDTKLRRLATSLVKKMFRDNDDIIDVAYRIHKWGSKSVHQGQIVPISVIWFSLFSIWNKLPPMFRAATPTTKSIKKDYDELLHNHKVRAIEDTEVLDPTFSNLRFDICYIQFCREKSS
jgi:hypothetical protein